MFLDARGDLPSDTRIECDLCVMGAGAAGITIARELASTGLSIYVLESGGLEFEDEIQALYKGTSIGHEYPALDIARLRFFGGSTNHWEGSCHPLEAVDFERRSWIAHSGWPITRSQLDPFYVRAQKYCGLGPFDYDAAHWVGKIAGKPLPLRADRVRTAISQLSPPVRFGIDYRQDLETAAHVVVLLHATVVDIIADPSNGQVSHVRFGELGGKRFTLSARAYVLALGGIENPRLLLSSNGVHPNGLGNQNDLVGRFFMDHPVVEGAILKPSDPKLDLSFYGVSDTQGSYRLNAHLELADEVLRQEQLVNIGAPFIPRDRYYASPGIESYHDIANALAKGRLPPHLWGDIGDVARDFDMVVEASSRRLFGRRLFSSAEELAYFGFDTMTEQTPNPESRVTLGDERDPFGMRRVKLDWRLSNSDKENLWRCYEVLGAELGRAGIGRVRLLRDREDALWTTRLSYGDHHMGTTRMSEDPRFGVVDADCRVHSVLNLYVAGSSVFPTGGHVPPTLTIVALAIRLADHLKSVFAV
ncbi:MAG TPA: GMC family oxidoreductase [Stellaceae bacterium]|nr:GMC family oxidoreductase [Stellaceae bacterium]